MDEKVVEMNLSLDEEKSADNEVTVETVKHYEDTNRAEIEGTMVSRFDAGKAVLLTILVTTGREKNETSGITVVATGDLYEKAVAIKEVRRVKVTGEMRTIPDRKNPGFYTCQVFAKELEEAKSQLEEEFDIKGRVYDQSFNRVFVVGTVSRLIQINRNYIKVVIQVKSDKKTRYIEGSLIARNMKNVIPHVMVGSRICAVLEMRSTKKEIDGKPVFRKDAYIVDMKEI